MYRVAKTLGCLKLQVIFRKRATNYRTLLRKITYKDKASYGSSPPCTYTQAHTPSLSFSLTQKHNLHLQYHIDTPPGKWSAFCCQNIARQWRVWSSLTWTRAPLRPYSRAHRGRETPLVATCLLSVCTHVRFAQVCSLVFYLQHLHIVLRFIYVYVHLFWCGLFEK